uniref:Uncharacterized protein n=1 Tax=Lepeophtheirus salmonis TaxID=72036 RepID=A0A0K2V3E3_LEPSM
MKVKTRSSAVDYYIILLPIIIHPSIFLIFVRSQRYHD